MDDVAVLDALTRLMNEPCLSLRALASGASSSATYVARLADRDVVVKANLDESVLDRTGHNFEVLIELGVPVPTLLAHGQLEPGPGAVVIMERIAGVDVGAVIDTMTPAQLSSLAQQIVDMQRAVATLPAPDGCGYVGIGEPATRSWSDVVHRPNEHTAPDQLPSDSAHLVPRLAAALDRAEPYFGRVVPIAFLDDVTTKNVMISDGELSGVVDFDVICYGDPLFHPGLTAAAVTANAERPESRFYVDELVRLSHLDDEQQRIVDLYEAVFLTNFLTAENPDKPGVWRKRAIDGAERALTSAHRAAQPESDVRWF